jgi:hypothetical protein
MSVEATRIREEAQRILEDWIASCTQDNRVARNTVAIGIVTLDHLRQSRLVSRDAVVSKRGEIKGSRSGLGKLLGQYGIPANYLKEVTTRQGHQDGQRLFEALGWGEKLTPLSDAARDALLLELIETLLDHAREWLKQQNLKLAFDRRHGPTAWMHLIIESAKDHSGGIVEQHLVGAKLERRFAGQTIENYPAHAGDKQTAREGDFSIASLVYHVTATPTRSVIQKCAANAQAGKLPALLTTAEQVGRARALAQDEGVEGNLVILSIEDFVGLNIIELATAEEKSLFEVLQEIVSIYNRRLREVETDLSLQIEAH